jgi:digeranylgeranylglycerophospholipid reductase
MVEIVYSPNTENEVAVIGAGPAGLSAAYHLAKQNIKTIILEEHPQVGRPVHCGEGLSSLALKRMGLEDVPSSALGLKIKGIKIIFPNGQYTVFREEGYDLNKDLFEQYLLEKAIAAGASLQAECRVFQFSRKNGIWSINSNKMLIKSKAIVDATGYQSLGNKILKLDPNGPNLIAGAQYLIDNVKNDGFIEFYIDPKLAPGGYLWLMPKDKDRANVGLVSTDSINIHKNLKMFLTKVGLDKNKIIRPFGGMIPCSGPIKKTYAEGIILVGDAAGFTSPMFEGGTQLALKSGQIAAYTLAKAKEIAAEKKLADPYIEELLKNYEIEWRKNFPPYQKILQGKKFFYSFSEEELNTIAKILPNDLTNLDMVQKIKILIRLFTIGKNIKKTNFFKAMETFSYSVAEKYGW